MAVPLNYQLTDVEVENYKKKFAELDRDNDGYFTLDDYLVYLTEKKQNQGTMEAALHNTKVSITKVKKKTKEFVSAGYELRFEKTAYVKVKIISKETDSSGKGWKQFLYKPYYENNAIMLKCYDPSNGNARNAELDIDFRKLSTVDIQMIDDEKKSRFWFTWKISSLPHEFACTSQQDLEQWTQNIRYLHNRVAVSKAKIKAAEANGLIRVSKAKQKDIDPALLEELKSLDPFTPGKTKEEKEAIWKRINEIRDLIGAEAFENGGDDDGIDTESLSSEKEEDIPEGEEENEGGTATASTEAARAEEAKTKMNLGLDLGVLKKAASTTSRKVAEKTKDIAGKTKEKSEILSSRTAVSARALKSSVGSLSKSVSSRVKDKI